MESDTRRVVAVWLAWPPPFAPMSGQEPNIVEHHPRRLRGDLVAPAPPCDHCPGEFEASQDIRVFELLHALHVGGIRTRHDLAKRYPIFVGRTSIYRTFDEEWGGRPTHNMLTTVSSALGVRLES
jgi:hypothetical protein